MMREVGILYEAYCLGRDWPSEELPIQYVDYAVWQRLQLQGELLESQLDYWRKELASPPLLSLPLDKTRPALQTFDGARLSVAIGPDLTQQLRELGHRQGVTLFMILLAGFQVLLHRYSGQDDILVELSLATVPEPSVLTLAAGGATIVGVVLGWRRRKRVAA